MEEEKVTSRHIVTLEQPSYASDICHRANLDCSQANFHFLSNQDHQGEMSSTNQARAKSQSPPKRSSGAFLTIPKIDHSRLATLPPSKPALDAVNGEDQGSTGGKTKLDSDEIEHEEAGDCSANSRPRASEDTQRFMDSMRTLEDGFDIGLAFPKRKGKKEEARPAPTPKPKEFLVKNVKGMDFFDQLDALEGGYFPPM